MFDAAAFDAAVAAPLFGFLNASRTCCALHDAPFAGITTPSVYLVRDFPSEILHSPLLGSPLGAVIRIPIQFKASFNDAILASCRKKGQNAEKKYLKTTLYHSFGRQ
jgi:hypothetical protein